MMVTGFLLRQVLETNCNLVKKLIEEVIREEISEINESENKFGYNYSSKLGHASLAKGSDPCENLPCKSSK